MNLTSAQRTTLRTLVNADGTMGALNYTNSAANDQAAADWLNGNSTFTIWRSNITPRELLAAYVPSEMPNLGVPQSQYLQLLTNVGAIDATQPNVRSAFGTVFAAGTMATTLAAVTAVAKRLATRAEQGLGTTGTGTNGNPGVATFEGTVTLQDAGAIMRG